VPEGDALDEVWPRVLLTMWWWRVGPGASSTQALPVPAPCLAPDRRMVFGAILTGANTEQWDL
jgi:hypothetical protein